MDQLYRDCGDNEVMPISPDLASSPSSLSLTPLNSKSQSAHQRLIALCPTPITKIPALLKYLDTFYTDPAGWSFLAELYADLGLYAQSFSALGHLLLIQPWDTFAIIRCAETCYTMRYVMSSVFSSFFLR